MAFEKETQKFISDAHEHIKKIAAKWLFVFEHMGVDVDFKPYIKNDLGYEVKAYIAGIIQTLEGFSVLDEGTLWEIRKDLEEYVEKIQDKIANGESLPMEEGEIAMKDACGDWKTNSGERLYTYAEAMHAITVNCEARERSVNS